MTKNDNYIVSDIILCVIASVLLLILDLLQVDRIICKFIDALSIIAIVFAILNLATGRLKMRLVSERTGLHTSVAAISYFALIVCIIWQTAYGHFIEACSSARTATPTIAILLNLWLIYVVSRINLKKEAAQC